MSKTSTNHLESALRLFRQYKTLAESAISQLSTDQLFYQPDAESNSVYLIIKHLSGNMRSRWTDFLTTDGEKTWRNRDDEFEQHTKLTREEVMQEWEAGWHCLFDALTPLQENQLGNIVTIRGEAHSVLEAVNRQIAHYSYHVGQIVFLAKMLKQQEWKTLSIAKGKSDEYNANLKHNN